MTQTSKVMNNTERFLELYKDFRANRNGEPTWLKSRRDAAIQRFEELGFPTRKSEPWKYTPVKSMVSPEYTVATKGNYKTAQLVLDNLVYWETSNVRLTFVDGHFSPELSVLDNLPDGLTVDSVANMLKSNPAKLEEAEGRHVEHLNDGFRALNSAFSGDGAFIEIANGVELADPIHVLYINGTDQDQVMASPRNVISVGRNSSCTIVERYAGAEHAPCYLLNGLTEFWLDVDSRVQHYKIQLESESAFHVGVSEVHQEANSSFKSVSICVGGKVGRSEFYMEQGGAHTFCEFSGLYVVDGERVADQFVIARHTKDHSRSEQFFKGIMDDRGVGIFNGAIIAEEGVVGTDAHQTNKNLLLSDHASAQTRPQLEIYCDEIACSHGATVGQLDDESLFYLRSRGIPESQGRAMLTRAFAGDVLERIDIAPMRERLETFLADRVHWEIQEKGGN
ncbi:MAG: Fe-S cluster assembly protein SufD [Planctomycetota bacterium]|jgi:Fe-S cluster assembly protein SufD